MYPELIWLKSESAPLFNELLEPAWPALDPEPEPEPPPLRPMVLELDEAGAVTIAWIPLLIELVGRQFEVAG